MESGEQRVESGEQRAESGEWLICGVMDRAIVGEMGQSSAAAMGSGMGRQGNYLCMPIRFNRMRECNWFRRVSRVPCLPPLN